MSGFDKSEIKNDVRSGEENSLGDGVIEGAWQ
jgi:hypothetical protein